ncbi:MAG TPA: CHAT domain-containing protein, partial [Bryobacteraceae bacterium]|nr:CHAT domain-containing protein [Bryobacteraceae bacterium]
RVSSEIGLQAIYDSYLKAGMALYEQNRSRNLAEQMFEVAEQSRTTVFEQSLLHSAELPAEYWETLGRYRKLLARSLSSDDDQLASETASLRVRLAEIEASFGFESNTAENSHQINERTPAEPALRRLQGNLKEQEAFLSFHTGAEATYLWAVTRETFEVHKLPARKLLAGAVSEFRDAVRFRNRRARALGDRVRNLLLSGLSAPVQSRRHWILSLDGPLFELPFAAIPVQAGWLGQQHTLRLVPGSLTTHGPEVPASTQFAGWGDPLYNRADLRWKQPPAAVDVELERLPGSGRELRECSRAWTQDATPLIRTGAEVRREDLLNSLKANPAVVHLAMHVVPHPRRADQLLIALGALPTGEAQFLSAAEVAAQRARVGLVTLSGCGSGNGQSVAGVGLFGLIRAWLTGGARAVVATHWPITDDSGFLLASMYRELATAERLTSASVAEALQTAQGSMIAAGGWKADPGYWSAFAVTGKE